MPKSYFQACKSSAGVFRNLLVLLRVNIYLLQFGISSLHSLISAKLRAESQHPSHRKSQMCFSHRHSFWHFAAVMF